MDKPKTNLGEMGSAQPVKGLPSFLLTDNPAIQSLVLAPLSKTNPIVNDEKIRRLFIQGCAQQWYALQKLDFGLDVQVADESHRRVIIKINEIFYTLEKMGLNVIANMMTKAASRLKSEEVASYLAVQCHDEARHVFIIENYLKKLGAPPVYDRKLHVLGQAASMGFYRVENWLFSTLFSENFASAFLRRGKTVIQDKFGSEMCRHLLVDESRHLHFLHIVLPDVLDRLSLFGRTYVRASQFFIMKFTEMVSRTLDHDVALIGIDRREMLEEVFEHIEGAYASFGVSRKFLWFPTIKSPKGRILRPTTEAAVPTVH